MRDFFEGRGAPEKDVAGARAADEHVAVGRKTGRTESRIGGGKGEQAFVVFLVPNRDGFLGGTASNEALAVGCKRDRVGPKS